VLLYHTHLITLEYVVLTLFSWAVKIVKLLVMWISLACCSFFFL
jgi:hypothetical protein